MANSTCPSQHNCDVALQRYLLLQEHHESLCQHLNAMRPPGSALSSSSLSPTTSSVGSPTETLNAAGISSLSSSASRSYSLGRSANRHHPQRRRSSLPTGASYASAMLPLESIPDETLSVVAADEAQLSRINEGIKRALTELLNCATVRADGPFRTWVQTRLMDTERELRSGRRRRSAPDA